MSLTKEQLRNIKCLFKLHAPEYLEQPGDLVASSPKALGQHTAGLQIMGFNPGGNPGGEPLEKTLEFLSGDCDTSITSYWKNRLARNYCRIREIVNITDPGRESAVVNLFPVPSCNINEWLAARNSREPLERRLTGNFNKVWPIHEYIIREVTKSTFLIAFGVGYPKSVFWLLWNHFAHQDGSSFIEWKSMPTSSDRAVRWFAIPPSHRSRSAGLKGVIGIHHPSWRMVKIDDLMRAMEKIQSSE